MDPELGPEPTQIGAMPLISFGENTPLVSKIGEPVRPRPSAGSLPPPTATFLPEVVEPSTRKRNKLVIIIGIAVVVMVIVVIVLVAR
jgi:hypothetical protein